MTLTLDEFKVPVKKGPTKEQLERAIQALAEVKEVERKFYARAAARGEHPSYVTGNDYEYCCVVLEKANLRWSLQSRFLNYNIKARAKKITRHDDHYIVEFDYQNRYTRILKASPETSYLLEPDTRYDYRIIYNPSTGVGHVSMLGKHAT